MVTDDSSAAAGSAIHLYYLGSDFYGDAGLDPDPHRIFEASSTDGVHFEEQGLVFTSDAGNDPDIFPLGGAYALFTSIGPTITIATSPTLDGTFTPQAEIDWYGGGGPSTIEIDGQYRTFFCGSDGIKVSTLDTGPWGLEPFTDALLNPFDSGFICDPNVVKLGEHDYRLFYHWSPGLEVGPWGHAVYAATSTDGLTYTALPTEIRAQSSVPGAVYVDGVLYLYVVDGTGGGAPDDDEPGLDTAKIDDVSGLVVGISHDDGVTWDFDTVELEGSATKNAFDPDPLLVEAP